MNTAYHRHRHHRMSATDQELLRVLVAALVVLAVMASVVGALTVAGGSDTPATDPNFPRPAGYHFQSWHVTHTITICVDPEGGPRTERPLLDLVRDAVGRWQYVTGGKLPLVVAGLCPGRGLHDDRNSVVGWSALSSPKIAQTQLSTHSDEVNEADITLRPDENPSAACLLSVLLHEVGHVAGLAHQAPGATSIMLPGLSCGMLLSQSDIAAIRSLYH
jgi:Matrixin